MPSKLKRPCLQCGKVSDKAYCPEHQKAIDKKRFETLHRKHHSKLHDTKAWQRLRASYKREHPFCEKCGEARNLHVHHKVSPQDDWELFFDKDNLQTLCKACHAKKGLGNAR